MKSIFLLIYLIVGTSLSLAQVSYEGELTSLGAKTQELEEGAVFSGVIRVWKKDGQWKEVLGSLEGQKIDKYFYLLKVEKIATSPNNEEVAELFGDFVLIQAFKPQAKISFTHKNTQIVLEIRKINSIANAPVGEEFEYVEQPENDRIMGVEIRYIAIASLLAAGIVLIIVYRKIKNKREIKNKKNKWVEAIRNASSREEIESIGKHISEIKEILLIETEQVEQFVNKLNEVQYRKDWTDAQREDLKRTMKSLVDV